MAANDRQEGGSHYQQCDVQPWDIAAMYGLDFFCGNAMKYILRDKPGVSRVEDLKKAIHYLEKKIEILNQRQA